MWHTLCWTNPPLTEGPFCPPLMGHLFDRPGQSGRHFSQHDYNGHRDVQISILEFIRAPLGSPQGALIRTRAPPRSPQRALIQIRVERNWTHLLRCLAPQELNAENPNMLLSKPQWLTPPLPQDHNWCWHLSWSLAFTPPDECIRMEPLTAFTLLVPPLWDITNCQSAIPGII